VAALRQVQKAIRQKISHGKISEAKLVVIAARGNVTMRMLNEEKLFAVVRGVAKTAGFETVVFKSSETSLSEALELFASAALVVGVHGGALANLVACDAEKSSVLEIGFSTIGAQQYAHIASALGLRYQVVLVKQDPLKRSIGSPEIDVDFDKVSLVVAQLLAEQGKKLPLREEL
jgi:capsular polysaccharide biosynthesis protein